MGRIQHLIANQIPEELPHLVVQRHQCLQPVFQWLDLTYRFQRLEARFVRRRVFERVAVQSVNFAVFAYPLVATFAGLIAQQAQFRHFVLERLQLKPVAEGIVRHGRVKVLHHVQPDVEPHNIL